LDRNIGGPLAKCLPYEEPSAVCVLARTEHLQLHISMLRASHSKKVSIAFDTAHLAAQQRLTAPMGQQRATCLPRARGPAA
jgi:hypothetical protein